MRLWFCLRINLFDNDNRYTVLQLWRICNVCKINYVDRKPRDNIDTVQHTASKQIILSQRINTSGTKVSQLSEHK